MAYTLDMILLYVLLGIVGLVVVGVAWFCWSADRYMKNPLPEGATAYERHMHSRAQDAYNGTDPYC